MPSEMTMVIAEIHGLPTMHQHSLYINLFNINNHPYEVGTFRFILQMWKLRRGEINLPKVTESEANPVTLALEPKFLISRS